MSRAKNKRFIPFNPVRCWVGDKQKVSYPDEETAEMSAHLTEVEHDLPSGSLSWYHCEYGDHWHLANSRNRDSRH